MWLSTLLTASVVCDIHLQRQNFFVDAVEVVHGYRPWTQAGHIAAHLLGCLEVEVFHVKVRKQQLSHLLIDHILRELQQIVEKSAATHHLFDNTVRVSFRSHSTVNEKYKKRIMISRTRTENSKYNCIKLESRQKRSWAAAWWTPLNSVQPMPFNSVLDTAWVQVLEIGQLQGPITPKWYDPEKKLTSKTPPCYSHRLNLIA